MGKKEKIKENKGRLIREALRRLKFSKHTIDAARIMPTRLERTYTICRLYLNGYLSKTLANKHLKEIYE